MIARNGQMTNIYHQIWAQLNDDRRCISFQKKEKKIRTDVDGSYTHKVIKLIAIFIPFRILVYDERRFAIEWCSFVVFASFDVCSNERKTGICRCLSTRTWYMWIEWKAKKSSFRLMGTSMPTCVYVLGFPIAVSRQFPSFKRNGRRKSLN